MEGAPRDSSRTPGSAWGAPASGPGSVASVGRRFGSYAIDWALCAGLSMLLRDGSPTLVWPLFTALNVVMLSLFGATAGQFVLRVRVRPVTRRWPMVLRSVVRTLLLLLLIPALVTDRDGRPLHDVAAGTATVRA